jgi:TrmH family RNA methyltransferase
VVHELFVTSVAATRDADLVRTAAGVGIRVSTVTDRAATGLSETVTPQGIVAVCDLVDRPLGGALGGAPRLVAVLCGVSDPGNAGTVIRVADAAGADAVVFAADTVDPHNGKCVRASAGSLFHIPVARVREVDQVLAAARRADLRLVAADGRAADDLGKASRDGRLTRPTAWLFGSEAHGLDASIVTRLDDTLRVPMYGRAESLNLATAVAVCLYASAAAHHAQ